MQINNIIYLSTTLYQAYRNISKYQISPSILNSFTTNSSTTRQPKHLKLYLYSNTQIPLFVQVGQTQGDIVLNIHAVICLHYIVTYDIHNKHYKITNYTKHSNIRIAPAAHLTPNIQHLHDKSNILTLYTYTSQIRQNTTSLPHSNILLSTTLQQLLHT